MLSTGELAEWDDGMKDMIVNPAKQKLTIFALAAEKGLHEM